MITLAELRKKSEEELQEYLSAATNEAALEELEDLLEVHPCPSKSSWFFH